MMAVARNWLPADAYTGDAMNAALSALLFDWAGRWFADACAGISTAHADRPRQANGIQVKAAHCEAEMSGRGKRLLVEAALCSDLSGKSLVDSDHKILEAFAIRIMRDLLDDFEGLNPGDGEKGGDVSLGLSLKGSEIGTITVPAHVLVPLIKSAMGGPRKSENAVRAVQECLKPMTVTTQAVLGSAILGLADISDLGVGDVVLLETTLKDPVELRLSSSGHRIGCGRLGRIDGRVSVQF